MPVKNGPGDEQPEQHRFISEKIVKRPRTKRQIANHLFKLAASASVFGVVAAVTFTISKPVAERFFMSQPTEEVRPVTIPRDEPETSASVTEGIPQPSEEETEPIEEALKTAMEKYQFTTEDLNTLYSNLKVIAQEADHGVVTIHSVRQQVDWFDNPIENTGLFAGVIIAAANGEVLVLTPGQAVEGADSIKVAFSDGTEAAGSVKQRDLVSGLAVVRIGEGELPSEFMESIKPVELGNSYSVKQGDLIVAVGSPAGMVHSSGYGFVSYIARNIQVPDGVTRVIYTDIRGNASTGTFLLNTSGQLVGWVTDDYRNENNEGFTAAMSISEYKSILEKMTNGVAVSYLGIRGQEVSAAMNETGIPLGVYITDSITDGPAYNAGIQSGDIIIGVGESEIVTMKDLQMAIDGLAANTAVKVLVCRNGREEYIELEYQVMTGAR